jgi:ABC-type Fe3+ transport system permease subunit/streptogramin lyase
MNWVLLANSLIVAGAATFVALFIGTGAAVAMTVGWKWGRRLMAAFSIATLALPSFLVTNCWIDLLGVNGLLHPWLPVNIFSQAGAIGILTLLFWPIPALALWGAWQKFETIHFEVDPALRGWRVFQFLLWPAAKAHFAWSAAIIFALALNNFAVPTILQVKVFSSETWVQFNTNLDALGALQMSWPLILAPVGLLLFLRRTQLAWPRETTADAAPILRRRLGMFWVITCISLCSAALAVSFFAPLAQLAATTRTWTELLPAFQAGHMAVLNSILYSASAACLALALAVVFGRFRMLGWMWIFFFIPGVLLGIGAVVTFNRPIFDLFSRTAAIVIAILVVRYFAIAQSISRAALGAVDHEVIDCARLEGAKGLSLFRKIILPQIAPQIGAAAYVVYLLCLWDVESILLVIPPGGETLALRVFNLLHYGHNAHVNALCLLLLLLAILPLFLWGVFKIIGRARGERPQAAATILLLATFVVGCSRQDSSPSTSARQADSLFVRVEVLGTRGTGPGEFNKPRSLTLDTNDNLYVVDMTGRVQKFSPDGKFLLSWQMPQTDLGKPKGMCRDRNGNIVVVEPHYQRANHFSPEGKLVSQWGVKGTNAGELTLPRAVAVDTKNNVIVSEYTLVDRVQKFSAQGQRLLANWGGPGLAPGQFNRAEGLCVDSTDRIYVADSCNHRIQVFSSDGKFLSAYGKAGTAAGEFSYPYDIQVDAQGRQFVCEFGNSRIQVFDASNKSIEVIGKAGGAPGEFNNPWSIALDSKGNLYVADSQNHRVQKLIRREGR